MKRYLCSDRGAAQKCVGHAAGIRLTVLTGILTVGLMMLPVLQAVGYADADVESGNTCTKNTYNAVYAAEKTGPYEIILSYTGNPQTSMTVTWHSAYATVNAGVKYSTAADMKNPVSVKASRVEIKSGIPTDDYVYSAKLTGLTAGSVYYYTVNEDIYKGSGTSAVVSGSDSAVKSFETAPLSPEASSGSDSFAFMYMGDIQVESDASSEYAQWGKMAALAYKLNPDVKFGLFGGDIVESGISTAQFNYFLENAESVFSRIPLMTTNGNHESNFPDTGKPELYLDLFSLPENGPKGYEEEFYSFDYSNCHVTVLNSWVFSGEQKVSDADFKAIEDWISEDLGNSKSAFKIVLLHHSAYALAEDNVCSSVNANWAPLFEKYGVQLVLCGHQHVYARSYPLTSGSIDYDNGVTYVMGVAGEKSYSAADETLQERVIYNERTYQVIRIDGNQLILQSYDNEGNELDYWTVSANTVAGGTGTVVDSTVTAKKLVGRHCPRAK